MVDGTRRHIGLLWPRRGTRPELVGVRFDPVAALASEVLGPPNWHCWDDLKLWSGGIE